MPDLSVLKTRHGFQQLGPDFYSQVQPQGFQRPRLVSSSPAAAALIGLDRAALSSDEFLQLAAGNRQFAGSTPLAMVYSGHQFGAYVPQLGDGRALMLAELEGPEQSWELQLKGAGTTPYSRFGDGRAVLRSTIREYLCSEAMHGLGIATTRALSITTGELQVQRETAEPAAMLIRMARSHVRFGSFEFFHYTGQHAQVKTLADYLIERFHPDLADSEQRYGEFFRRTLIATADLMAHWQAAGFAHGVMNTDNMSIIGDTLDYGPFGFLDRYDPSFICNQSDHGGRYAFQRQPAIGLWNCNALAQALSSLIDGARLNTALQQYQPHFQDRYLELMSAKLGLADRRPDDQRLIDSVLATMAANQVDYSLFFRRLCDFDGGDNQPLRELFGQPDAFDRWAEHYRRRLRTEPRSAEQRAAAMRAVNPKYILRNYLAEIAIRNAEDQGDYREVNQLLTALSAPFDEHPALAHYAEPPPAWSRDICVSCSS